MRKSCSLQLHGRPWGHCAKWNKADKYCMISLICGILKVFVCVCNRKGDQIMCGYQSWRVVGKVGGVRDQKVQTPSYKMSKN